MGQEHEKWMRRCFQLAMNGSGRVAPNPMVGAVLVHNNRIIGEGWHRRYGGDHAEVDCVKQVTETDKRFLPESTLYVSLEPCAHHGKTPPCADFIVQQKIPRVVVCCRDPFHQVNGSGINILERKGVEVIYGLLEKEGEELNKVFFTFHQKQRPYIYLKWAQTADGFLGSGTDERLHITGAAANTFTHRLRSECAAIMVGTRTALLDEPALTTRYWPGKSPLRIVPDFRLSLPVSHTFFHDGVPTIIINKTRSGDEGNVTWYPIGDEQELIPAVLSLMHQRMLSGLLVEGGAALLQSFIDADMWDEAIVLESETLTLGKGLKAPMLHRTADKKISLPQTRVYIFDNRNFS